MHSGRTEQMPTRTRNISFWINSCRVKPSGYASFSSWHKALYNRSTQLNEHLILCFYEAVIQSAEDAKCNNESQGLTTMSDQPRLDLCCNLPSGADAVKTDLFELDEVADGV